MLTKLRKLRELSPRERGTLFRALALLPIVSLALRLLGFERTRKLLERSGRPSAGRPFSDEAIATVSRMVRVAARHLPVKAGCLSQSLVAWSLFRRSGVACELRFGARRDGPRLLAHAWLELPRGRRFDTDVPGGYSAFPQPPGAPARSGGRE